MSIRRSQEMFSEFLRLGTWSLIVFLNLFFSQWWRYQKGRIVDLFRCLGVGVLNLPPSLWLIALCPSPWPHPFCEGGGVSNFLSTFFCRIGGGGFKFLSLWGRSCWADTLVGQLDWGRTHLNQDIGVLMFWILDLGFWGAILVFFLRGRCTLSRNYTGKQNSREIFTSTFLERSRFFGKKRLWAELCTIFWWFSACRFAHCADQFAPKKDCHNFWGRQVVNQNSV